jgi:CRP-like cAMP-binding protein
MPAAIFRELLETEPKVAKMMLKYFVMEIRELTTRVYEFSTLAARYRIQAEVLRLAGLTACEGKTANIVPAPTHAEIASRTSTHREAVTRELNRLSKLGIIEQRNRVLLVRDVDRLSALVHDAIGD